MEIWSKSFEINSNQSQVLKDIKRLKASFNGQNFLRNKHTIPKFVREKYKKADIIIYQHALERWNERVGPTSCCEEISELFKILIRLNRVVFSGEDYGYIDNDILFVYEWTGNREISIVTFYGRISVNIALQCFSTLRKYNRYKEDQLKLTLSEPELVQQCFPVLPYRVDRFFYDAKKYELTYYIIEKEEYLIFIEQGKGKNKAHLIHMKELHVFLQGYPEIKDYLSEAI